MMPITTIIRTKNRSYNNDDNDDNHNKNKGYNDEDNDDNHNQKEE